MKAKMQQCPLNTYLHRWIWVLVLALMLPMTSIVQAKELSINQKMAAGKSPNDNGGVSSEPYLGGITKQPAQGIAFRPTFEVAERTKEIKRFPCQECHSEPLEKLKATAGNAPKAHWNIELKHAAKTVMTCSTCHTSDKMNELHTLNNQSLDFNHSYQLCGQCHSSQLRDWGGGAHGKRIGGWATPRVVNGCPYCHNPHQPKLESRWPSRSSRLPGDHLKMQEHMDERH